VELGDAEEESELSLPPGLAPGEWHPKRDRGRTMNAGRME
jgi:hypothetical protein